MIDGRRRFLKKKTNFDRYLEEQWQDKTFEERFRKAGEAWDMALKLAALRKNAGISQKELAKRVGRPSSRSAASNPRPTRAIR